eukprot:jgi/Mesvir1/15039/Mv14692-RA.1
MSARLNGSIKGDRRNSGPSAFATSQVKSLWDDKEINANAKFRELRRAVERWRAQPTRIPKERAFYSALQTLLENVVRGGTGPVMAARMDELHAWYTSNRPNVDISQELSIDGIGGERGSTQATSPSSRPLIKSLATLGSRANFANVFSDADPPIKPPRLTRQSFDARGDGLSESLSMGCIPRYPSFPLPGELEGSSSPPMSNPLDSSLSPVKRFPARSIGRSDPSGSSTKNLAVSATIKADAAVGLSSDDARGDARNAWGARDSRNGRGQGESSVSRAAGDGLRATRGDAQSAAEDDVDEPSDREDDGGATALASAPWAVGVPTQGAEASELVYPDMLPPRCHTAMDLLGDEALEAGVWETLRTRGGAADREPANSRGKPLSLLQRLARQEEGKLERLRASWQEVEQRDAKWQHDVKNAMTRWSIHRSRLEEEMTRRQESSRMLAAAPRFHVEVPVDLLTQPRHIADSQQQQGALGGTLPRGVLAGNGSSRQDGGSGRDGADGGGRPTTGPSSYGSMTRLSPYTDVDKAKGGYNKVKGSSLGTMHLNQVLAEEARQEAASLANSLAGPLSQSYEDIHEKLERALSPPPQRSTDECMKVLPKPSGTFDPAIAFRRPSDKKKSKPRSRLLAQPSKPLPLFK